MKEKSIISGNHYFQEILPLGCWAPVCRKKKSMVRRLGKRYQKGVDLVVAVLAVGVMFLVGIWVFLVELAEYGLHF
jgi:hypothetical protein